MADPGSPADSAQLTEPLVAGDIVDSYRVVQCLGRSGTSVVYLAEHAGLESPRRFAIKAIDPAGFDGGQERFERECEILATFDHPNIARIAGKGVTQTGWPYLVTDYIDGPPIHQFCTERKLAPPEVVRLLLDCCRAVQYLHGKLVVHGDLKPGNILVDATGSPRILNFGVTHLMDPDRRLTKSTDVYSLGVVLYASLTGVLPLDHADSPPLPSKTRRRAANSREDAVFARQIRGDLDNIVLKVMAHEPASRYGSMDELIADLKRYLAGEVVQSRYASWPHRAGRLLRRHRWTLAEVVAVGICLALAVGLASQYARHKRRDREAALRDEFRGTIRALLRPLPADLPGSMRERGMLFEHLSKTIESVSGNAVKDPAMAPDLADALLRIAELGGNPYYVNLGRVDDARVYYQRAFNLATGGSDAQSADIRARACLGLGDTYSHPTLRRDPAAAAAWYVSGISEILPHSAAFPDTAALAHSRMGLVCQFTGGGAAAQNHYREGLAWLALEKRAKPPLDAALTLLSRAGMEPPEIQGATYGRAVGWLDGMLTANARDIRPWHAAIEAHLSQASAELQTARRSAAREFASAAGLARQVVARDPEDIQPRRDLAIALRRSALIPAMDGKMDESNRLRAEATGELRMAALPVPAATAREAQTGSGVPSGCPSIDEQFAEGTSLTPLQAEDLLIANRSSGGGVGTLLVFSPVSREMSVLSRGRYLSDMADVAFGSRTELYVAGRSLTGAGGIVRLRYDARAGRWLEKPIACGGLLRRPVAIAFGGTQLVVGDADDNAARLIGVDLTTGGQTLLGRTDTFTEPGKMVRSPAGRYYLSLFWAGEGGPAEIARFDATTRGTTVAFRYGLLDTPVALAMTPRGDLIVGNREWAGNGGSGGIVRISRGGKQRVLYRSPELSRVTAVAAASERDAWYATAPAPFSPASLYKLDLVTGHSERVPIVGELLGAPNALVYVR